MCLAELIAPAFGKVFYAQSSASAFTQLPELTIGRGIPGVERLPDLTDALKRFDDIDVWIIPDLYLSGLAVDLRRRGANVWASGEAEVLELDRLKFKLYAEELGLDVGEYVVVTGMDELEERLKRWRGGGFVKTARSSLPRGDWETLRFRSWSEIRFVLEERRHKLGENALTEKFIIERPIDDAVELATDLFNVGGKFPDKGLIGLEMKAEGYLARVVDYGQYPASLREVNSLMAESGIYDDYSNLSPIECRITKDGRAWVLDPCLRFGRPPLSITSIITNWPDIFMAGAHGELEQPKFCDQWAAEMCIYCDDAERLRVPIHVPAGMEQNVRLSNYRIVKGERIVIPSRGVSGLGSISATGSTMQKAIEACRDAAKEITGYRVNPTDPFDKGAEQIAKMKEFGIDAFG